MGAYVSLAFPLEGPLRDMGSLWTVLENNGIIPSNEPVIGEG